MGKLEVRAFPIPFKTNVEVEMPYVVTILGMEFRGKAGVPKQLHVIALVDPESAPSTQKFRLMMEGVPSDDDGNLRYQPAWHASTDKPRPMSCWLFIRA